MLYAPHINDIKSAFIVTYYVIDFLGGPEVRVLNSCFGVVSSSLS